MARAQLAVSKAKRIRVKPAGRITMARPPPKVRFLVLEGTGHPDCAALYDAVEELEGVVGVLRGAMERAGRIGEHIPPIEKSWTFVHALQQWQWRVRAVLPWSITASAIELAKHLAGRARSGLTLQSLTA